jgi:hypothetical protein
MTTSFPKGPCSLGILCSAPTHELRKHCPGCSGWIHVVCGRVLEEDEGPFEADLVMCPGCDYMISQDKHPVVNEWKSKKQSSSSTVQDAGSKKLEQKKKKQVETEVKRKKKKQVVVGDQVSSKRQKPILTNQLINEQPNPQNQQPINQQPNLPNQQPINQQPNPPNQQPINQLPNQHPINQQPINQQLNPPNQQPINQLPNQQPINQLPNQQPINQLPNQQPINQQLNPPNQQPINQLPNQQPINQQLNLPNQQPINQQPNQTLRKSSKNKKPPKTTGRKSATNERVKIKVRRRVKISRFQLYHLLVTDEQRKKIPKDIPNKYNFFGTVISRGKNKGSWNVKFDVLPVDENVLHNISRVKLTVIADGEEEKPIGEDEHLDEVELKSDTEEDASPKKTKDDDVFCSQDKSALKESTVYTMKWGPGKSDYTDWAILPDSEYVTEQDFPLELPDVVHYHSDLGPDNISELDDHGNFFFKYIFPDIVGK